MPALHAAGVQVVGAGRDAAEAQRPVIVPITSTQHPRQQQQQEGQHPTARGAAATAAALEAAAPGEAAAAGASVGSGSSGGPGSEVGTTVPSGSRVLIWAMGHESSGVPEEWEAEEGQPGIFVTDLSAGDVERLGAMVRHGLTTTFHLLCSRKLSASISNMRSFLWTLLGLQMAAVLGDSILHHPATPLQPRVSVVTSAASVAEGELFYLYAFCRWLLRSGQVMLWWCRCTGAATGGLTSPRSSAGLHGSSSTEVGLCCCCCCSFKLVLRLCSGCIGAPANAARLRSTWTWQLA